MPLLAKKHPISTPTSGGPQSVAAHPLWQELLKREERVAREEREVSAIEERAGKPGGVSVDGAVKRLVGHLLGRQEPDVTEPDGPTLAQRREALTRAKNECALERQKLEGSLPSEIWQGAFDQRHVAARRELARALLSAIEAAEKLTALNGEAASAGAVSGVGLFYLPWVHTPDRRLKNILTGMSARDFRELNADLLDG